MWHKGQTTGVKYNQFHWAAHSAPDRQEWYRAPNASRGDRHGSFESLSWVSSCSEGYKEKARTGFKLSHRILRIILHRRHVRWTPVIHSRPISPNRPVGFTHSLLLTKHSSKREPCFIYRDRSINRCNMSCVTSEGEIISTKCLNPQDARPPESTWLDAWFIKDAHMRLMAMLCIWGLI